MIYQKMISTQWTGYPILKKIPEVLHHAPPPFFPKKKKQEFVMAIWAQL